jgi:hypothetical protein
MTQQQLTAMINSKIAERNAARATAEAATAAGDKAAAAKWTATAEAAGDAATRLHNARTTAKIMAAK